MRQFIQTWRESQRFLKNKSARNGIVIYSEGDSYDQFLRPVIDALAHTHDDKVHYLTSDPEDRILDKTPAHVEGYFIGKGAMRTYTLNNMHAKVLAMTMPDLNTFHIKRSPHVQHYNYLQHSLVSTHMIYRTGAFDHFDSVMCAGPHHVSEIKEWETMQSLPAKQLVEQGYPPLDKMMALSKTAAVPPIGENGRLNVLVAPSWGPEGLMETRAMEIVRILLDAGHFVHVRPHPRTRQMAAQALAEVATAFKDHPNFEMNEDITAFDALVQSHVMICDWSGVAMDYAFGFERPVLFIDVPRKVNNPEYVKMNAVPLEISYRDQVGAIIQPDRLAEIPAALATLYANAPATRAKIAALRETLFYNLGNSAKYAAEFLSARAK